MTIDDDVWWLFVMILGHCNWQVNVPYNNSFSVGIVTKAWVSKIL